MISSLPARAALGTAMAALLVATAITASAAPAAAAPTVACGATLVKNTKLTRDLTCTGTGLTLAAGVTLDLGGHRLIGNGAGVAVSADGSSGNRVVNGVIRRWAKGLDFVGATVTGDSALVIKKVRFDRAPLAVEAAALWIDKSELSASTLTAHASLVRITGSKLIKSSTTGELNSTVIEKSTVTGGGIGLEENNTIRVVDSTLDGTGFGGEPLGCDGSRSIVGSRIENYSYPVRVQNSCSTSVDDSVFVGNANGAITAEDGILVVNNSRFRNNGDAVVGAEVTIANSKFWRNATAITITNGSASRVLNTVVRDNSGSGIYTTTPLLTLANNTATKNGAYGIYALNSLDLGGNRASGNGTDQCVGLSCTP